MVVWIVVLVAPVLLLLAVAWRMDQRGTGRKGKYIEPPSNDASVGEAKVRSYFRDLGQMGPNGKL
jgi:hypothetical protein